MRHTWQPVGVFSKLEQRCNEALAAEHRTLTARRGWITAAALQQTNAKFSPRVAESLAKGEQA